MVENLEIIDVSKRFDASEIQNVVKQVNSKFTQLEQILVKLSVNDHPDYPRKYNENTSQLNGSRDEDKCSDQYHKCQSKIADRDEISQTRKRSENCGNEQGAVRYRDVFHGNHSQARVPDVENQEMQLNRQHKTESNSTQLIDNDGNAETGFRNSREKITKRPENTRTTERCIYLYNEQSQAIREKSKNVSQKARRGHNKQICLYDQKITLKRPAFLVSPKGDLLPKAKSEREQPSNFLSLKSTENKKDTTVKEPALVEEKPANSTTSRPCGNSVVREALFVKEPSAIALIFEAKSPASTEKREKATGGTYHVCLSVLSNAVEGELKIQTNDLCCCCEDFCCHIQCRCRDNMSEDSGRTAQPKSTGTDVPKFSNKTEKIKHFTPSKSSKRRESTSPDEGIVHSLDEMEEFSSLLEKKLLPDVENDGHIAITIEGGRPRESKVKRRNVRPEKGSHKHKTNGKNDTAISLSNENGHIKKHKEKNLIDNGASASSIAKVTRTEKATARKVVRKALTHNSELKSIKPVWVELPKNSKKISVSKQNDKRKNGQLHYHSDMKGIRKITTKHDGRTGKGAAKIAPEQGKDSSAVWKAGNHGTSRKSVGKYRRKTAHATKADGLGRFNARKDRTGDNNKAENRNLEIVRANNRDTSDSKRTAVLPKSRIAPGNNRTSTKSDIVSSNKSISADSSVRDLSYSSSSSYTTSSSSRKCYSTSSSFHSESTSSYSSRSSYSSTSITTSEDSRLIKGRKSNVRQTKLKVETRQSLSKGRIEQSKHRDHEYPRASIRTIAQDNGTAEHDGMDMKSIRKATREVEKSITNDEVQEFETNLERRRERDRKRCGEGDVKIAKDSQKNHWQHQRLVMTSKQNAHTTTDPRPSEKLKIVPETVSYSKERSFEASAKDSSGAILTIRDLYSLHQVLSDTQNGTVIAGHRRSDGKRVAIKRISKSATTRWGWMKGKVVPLELALLCQVNEVRHAGVVEIIEWHETTEAFLLVMVRPHPSVDLYDHVTKQKRLKERIIKQLVMALAHCQNMGVLHRDVKLENILFNPDTAEAVLIDFGCGDYCRSGSYKEFAGTPEYYPPEWFLYKQYSGDSATVWSIGVLMYSLLCGTLPFRSSKDIINKELSKFPVDLSRSARHLIWEALKKNVSDRIELKSILNHPWFRTSRELSGIRKTSV